MNSAVTLEVSDAASFEIRRRSPLQRPPTDYKIAPFIVLFLLFSFYQEKK
jgi:hypothetical protein